MAKERYLVTNSKNREPVIALSSKLELSSLLAVPPADLGYVVSRIDRFYVHAERPKPNGGMRVYSGTEPSERCSPHSDFLRGIRCATRPAQSLIVQRSQTVPLCRELPGVPGAVASTPTCRALHSLEGLPVDRINLTHLS